MLGRSKIYWLKILLFLAAYYLTGIIGLKINAVHSFASLIWAPSGIALAALLLLGYRAWPAISLAAFLVNVTVGAQPIQAVGIAAGNTLAALTAVYLLKTVVNFKLDLERGRDVFGIVFFAAFLTTIISATIGTTTLLISHSIQVSQYNETWIAWWIGDMLGVIIVAPLILIWTEQSKLKYNRSQVFELLAVSAVLLAASVFVFWGYTRLGFNENFSRYYLLYPPLIWIALRFGRRGAVTASFSLAVIAISSTISGLNSLSDVQIGKGLIYIQGFIGVTAVTLMTLAAVVAERENTVAREKNLERRTKLLTSQRKNLLALSKSKDEFVAITSHQLRTPATAVKQYLGLLLQGYSDPLTKNQKTFLRRAYDENIRQLHIIDDLLLTTRLDLGKVELNLETYDITSLITQTARSLGAKFAGRKQKIIFNKPKKKLEVKCDPKHLRAVIENLLENASNYSDNGSAVTISAKKVKGGFEIIIEDKGVGIKQADFPKLFQKFSRIPNKLSNTVNGTGLGLYFSQKIIELHGGAIKVDSLLNKGSKFTVFIPN